MSFEATKKRNQRRTNNAMGNKKKIKERTMQT